MPQLHDAFTYLVYPFCHTLSAADRMERLTALNRNWSHWWARLDKDGIDRVIDDSWFFLPYVREWLFPECNRANGGNGAAGTDRGALP